MIIQFTKQITLQIIRGNIGVVKDIVYYDKWKKALNSNSVADEHPCLTYPVLKILNNNINPGTKVFEYGGGGSTLYFLHKAKEVVTVEHNEKWYELLQKKITTPNWTGVFIKPVPGTDNLDPSNPDDYTTAEGNYVYKDYASYIDRYPDQYFNIVLVDGRSRPSCIKHSIPKIKKGGLLIIDDINRK